MAFAEIVGLLQASLCTVVCSRMLATSPSPWGREVKGSAVQFAWVMMKSSQSWSIVTLLLCTAHLEVDVDMSRSIGVAR